MNRAVLTTEIIKMSKYFPQFSLYETNHNQRRLFYWKGQVKPNERKWTILLLYEHFYPYVMDREIGGINVFIVEPNVVTLCKRYGKSKIPHSFITEFNGLKGRSICILSSDYYNSIRLSVDAPQACALACKWIFLFERWLINDLDYEFEIDDECVNKSL